MDELFGCYCPTNHDSFNNSSSGITKESLLGSMRLMKTLVEEQRKREQESAAKWKPCKVCWEVPKLVTPSTIELCETYYRALINDPRFEHHMANHDPASIDYLNSIAGIRLHRLPCIPSIYRFAVAVGALQFDKSPQQT